MIWMQEKMPPQVDQMDLGDNRKKAMETIQSELKGQCMTFFYHVLIFERPRRRTSKRENHKARLKFIIKHDEMPQRLWEVYGTGFSYKFFD